MTFGVVAKVNAVRVLVLLFVAAIRPVHGASHIGMGAHTCSEYLAATSNPAEDRSFAQWALGYMSGTLYTLKSGELEIDLASIKPETMRTFIRGYCSAHPSDPYFDAVDSYLLSLPTKPVRSAKPPQAPLDLDAINRSVDAEMAGPRGQEAREFCSRKVGVQIGVKDGSEVARRYGAQKSTAWTDCVADRVYPVPR